MPAIAQREDIIVAHLPVEVHGLLCGGVLRRPAKSIVYNTQFLVFNAKLLVFNAKILFFTHVEYIAATGPPRDALRLTINLNELIEIVEPMVAAFWRSGCRTQTSLRNAPGNQGVAIQSLSAPDS